MRLNKTYKTISLLFFSLLLFSNCFAETKDQRIKVNLRSICHEFLMQIQDSTSRIMPIEFIDGRYKVSFEENFAFEPDFLLFATYKLYKEKDIQEKFIVEVEECFTKALVHSFEIGITDITACKRRGLPHTCYNFYFTEIINKPMKNMEISKSDNQESFSFWWILALLLGLIGLLSSYYLIVNKQTDKNNKSKSSIPENPKQEDYNIQIGEYRYNKKNMKLVFKDHQNDLSAKEADLLLLFNRNENKVLERDFILNQVWGDDGTYSGRTLDVFISKLRKKLENDSNLKIINIRSVGYRFVKEDKAS